MAIELLKWRLRKHILIRKPDGTETKPEPNQQATVIRSITFNGSYSQSQFSTNKQKTIIISMLAYEWKSSSCQFPNMYAFHTSINLSTSAFVHHNRKAINTQLRVKLSVSVSLSVASVFKYYYTAFMLHQWITRSTGAVIRQRTCVCISIETNDAIASDTCVYWLAGCTWKWITHSNGACFAYGQATSDKTKREAR